MKGPIMRLNLSPKDFNNLDNNRSLEDSINLENAVLDTIVANPTEYSPTGSPQDFSRNRSYPSIPSSMKNEPSPGFSSRLARIEQLKESHKWPRANLFPRKRAADDDLDVSETETPIGAENSHKRRKTDGEHNLEIVIRDGKTIIRITKRGNGDGAAQNPKRARIILKPKNRNPITSQATPYHGSTSPKGSSTSDKSELSLLVNTSGSTSQNNDITRPRIALKSKASTPTLETPEPRTPPTRVTVEALAAYTKEEPRTPDMPSSIDGGSPQVRVEATHGPGTAAAYSLFLRSKHDPNELNAGWKEHARPKHNGSDVELKIKVRRN